MCTSDRYKRKSKKGSQNEYGYKREEEGPWKGRGISEVHRTSTGLSDMCGSQERRKSGLRQLREGREKKGVFRVYTGL